MKAGRELDNLMATEVMGWIRHDYTAPILGTDDVERWTEWTDKASCFKAICGVWKPSEDITAAMELIPIVLRDWDSTKEHDYEAEFGAWYKLDWWEENQANRGPRWWAAFGLYDAYEGGTWRYEAHAPELALAICLAVCEAKGIEIEQ